MKQLEALKESQFTVQENEQRYYRKSRKSIRRRHRNLNRNRPTRTRSTAAAASRTTRTGAGPTPNITVRPTSAETRDPTRAIASGASWSPARTHHGVLIHDLFHENSTGQKAKARGQLSQYNRTHNFLLLCLLIFVREYLCKWGRFFGDYCEVVEEYT
ncbi:hypothetical protein ACJIZ3_010432 [Penstemon smallii]|uniref:Uncharacterized protein n=1 Tax=Penstemon smallii TaxID=265156 RepID=A0ABD3TGG6_9LAMI